MKIMKNSIKGDRGFGLVEIGPAMAIGLIVSGALIATFNMNFTVQQNIKAQVEVANLQSEIVSRLANDDDCLNTFNGQTYNNTTDLTTITTIPGQPDFTTNTWYGGNLVQIQDMILRGNPAPGGVPRRGHAGTTYYGDFQINYLRIGQTQPDSRVIRIHFLLDNRNIVRACRALIGQVNHLWTPTFTTAGTRELHYLGGTVGIGPNFGMIQGPGNQPPLAAPPNGAPRIDQVYQGVPVTRNNLSAQFGLPAIAGAYLLDVGQIAGQTSFLTQRLQVRGNLFVSGSVLIANSLQVGSATTPGIIRANSFWQPSDRGLKRLIKSLRNPVEVLQGLSPVTFIPRTQETLGLHGSKELRSLGYLAQEVEEVLPEIVGTAANGYKTLAYHRLLPFTVEAIKEVATKTSDIQNQIEQIANMQVKLKKILDGPKTPKSMSLKTEGD